MQVCVKVLESVIKQSSQLYITSYYILSLYVALDEKAKCHKLLLEANVIKNLLARAKENTKVHHIALTNVLT